MCTIIYHCGQFAGSFTKHIVFNNNHGNAGHGHILLGASINSRIFRHVYRAAHNIWTHIRDKWNVYIEVLAVFRSINRIVGGNVQIINVSRNLKILRIVGVTCICRRGDFYNFTKKFCFFLCLLCPCSSVHISCFLEQEVGWNLHELQRSAASKENNRISAWYIK